MLGDSDVERVTASVSSLAQGDLVSTSHFVALGAPESTFYPDTEASKPIAGQGVWTAVGRPIQTGWGVIITQTCDLIRPPDEESWVQIAPLIDLKNEDRWQRARSGRALDVFSLPHVHGTDFAHSAIQAQLSFPVEKSSLMHKEVRTLATPLGPGERILLSLWLARRCGRHAFPDETEDLVLRPLRQEIARRWKKPDTQTGAFVRSLLGVWASAYTAPVIDVCFVMASSQLRANQSVLPNADAINNQVRVMTTAAARAIARSNRELRVNAFATTLDAIPAEDLLMRMRQVEVDLLPLSASFATEEVGAASG